MLSVNSCKKTGKLDGISENGLSANNAPPPTVPILPVSTTLDVHIDQWKHLSYSCARIFNDPSVCNGNNLVIDLNNAIVNVQEEPLSIAAFHNNQLSKPVGAFSIPGNTGDLYDAVSFAHSNTAAPGGIGTWMTDFYFGFNLLDVPQNTTSYHFNTISIPMRKEVQNGNLYWNLPRIVGPDPELFDVFPAVFYGYNSSTQQLFQITIADTEEYEDLIESEQYLVIVLGFDVDDVDPEVTSSFCEGGFVVGDGNCGENDINSPTDCNSLALNNKNVYLRDFTMNTDLKDKSVGTSLNERKYWERWASGNYKVKISSWIIRSSGNGEAHKKVPFEKIKRDEVERKRKKQNGNTKTWGTRTLQNGYKQGISNKRLLVAGNYNPSSSDLFIFFAEHDGWGNSKWGHVPVTSLQTINNSNYNGGSYIDFAEWRGCRGNMTAGKFNAYWWSNGGLNGSSNIVDARDGMFSFISPFPLDWVDEVFTTEGGAPVNVKVLYVSNQGDNKVDFVLMYARDKKDIYN